MAPAASQFRADGGWNSGVRGRHDTWATPGNKTRDSRPLRGAPSPNPLHLHPSQVPPAAQVEGEHAHNHHQDTWKGQQEQHGTGRQSDRADGG